MRIGEYRQGFPPPLNKSFHPSSGLEELAFLSSFSPPPSFPVVHGSLSSRVKDVASFFFSFGEGWKSRPPLHPPPPSGKVLRNFFPLSADVLPSFSRLHALCINACWVNVLLPRRVPISPPQSIYLLLILFLFLPFWCAGGESSSFRLLFPPPFSLSASFSFEKVHDPRRQMISFLSLSKALTARCLFFLFSPPFRLS